MGDAEPIVAVNGLNHWFGAAGLRTQILFDISLSVYPGEIVLLTGPSGSGKTTLLSLIGALRTVEEGSVRVLDQELCRARARAQINVRRGIGYVFQLHNLLDSLTVSQNVQMTLRGEAGVTRAVATERTLQILRAVGLHDHAAHYPEQLSGGQQQRAAVARALVRAPRLLLADEPTATLDARSGRDVVHLMHQLAKQQGCAVLLVTHDNRILDIADRIVHLEEGRLTSFTNAVRMNTQRLLGLLAQSNRKGEFLQRVRAMDAREFAVVLRQVTGDAQQLLEALTLSADDAFESMLDQALEAFTLKIGQLVQADRASLFLADENRGELWSKVAQGPGERAIEIRAPLTHGVIGHVYRTGETMNVVDAYESPLFNRAVDQDTGYRTRSLLCVPILDSTGRPFAVMEVLNKVDGSFTPGDENEMRVFAASIGVVLETWHRARVARSQS